MHKAIVSVVLRTDKIREIAIRYGYPCPQLVGNKYVLYQSDILSWRRVIDVRKYDLDILCHIILIANWRDGDLVFIEWKEKNK